MDKKGDLSLNTIASAVIVLLVVIILILIFTNKISLFSGSISGCESKPGAVCVDKSLCPDTAGDWYYSQQISFTCKDKDQVCCYSNCKASGGKCVSGGCGTDKEDLGSSDCVEGNVCCK